MNLIQFGDCREILRAWAALGITAQTCVTSPPYYGLRDYGHERQLGREPSPDEYIANLVEVFRCVRGVLSENGTLWLNIGDSYASGGRAYRALDPKDQKGIKPKDLIGVPWMLAFALRADGWYLRQDIIWSKPNPMPESVRDRCTKAHEYLFLLAKSEQYFFDSEAMREPCSEDMQRRAARGHTRGAGGKIDASRQDTKTLRGEHAKVIDVSKGRNRRSVWAVATRAYKGAHFATFPPELIEPCILTGSRPGDTVLDPFMGSGTTAATALLHGRRYLGCELNPEYGPLQQERIAKARQ